MNWNDLSPEAKTIIANKELKELDEEKIIPKIFQIKHLYLCHQWCHK